MGKFSQSIAGISFHINGAALPHQGAVDSWQATVFKGLVYSVSVSLNAGDVVTLVATRNTTVLYQEFSGYCYNQS